jgi:deoxyribose-phosphate aldolase
MNLASYMDSTNLKPEATKNEIIALCTEAARLKMAAVCINPYRLSPAKKILQETGVRICTVIGFPLGAEGMPGKVFAASQALTGGADELDMVINLGALKDGDYKQVEQEISGVLKLKKDHQFMLKVIVETALLTREELINLTHMLCDCGADFIKTSTGFSSRGAVVEDLQIISAHRTASLKIKASGGIKHLDFALQLIDAGADRLGSSNAAKILEEYEVRGGK